MPEPRERKQPADGARAPRSGGPRAGAGGGGTRGTGRGAGAGGSAAGSRGGAGGSAGRTGTGGARSGGAAGRPDRPDRPATGDRPARPARPAAAGGAADRRTPRAGDARTERPRTPRSDEARAERPRTPRSDEARAERPRTPRNDAGSARPSTSRYDKPAGGGTRSSAPRSDDARAERPRTPRSDAGSARPGTSRYDKPAGAPRSGSASGGRPAGTRTGAPARGGAPRTGSGRTDGPRSGPPRTGAPSRTGRPDAGPMRPRRDDRPVRPAGPALPPEADPELLPRDVRRELRGIPDPTIEKIAAHLVAAGQLVDDDPAAAYEHAKYAKTLASRVGAVREAVGVTAYRAGDFGAALTELKAARRITGIPDHLPLLADCERALGHPDKALAYASDPDRARLDRATQVELAIVLSGARRDLGQPDAAVLALQGPELDSDAVEAWTPRLWYAYADALLAAGRTDDAVNWFTAVATIDEDGETDADERLAEITRPAGG